MGTERNIIAVCATWEDVENLNLFLLHMIDVSAKRNILPVCITFDREIMEMRGEKGIWEFLELFDIRNLKGVVLFGEMIRSEAISGSLIRMAQERRIPVFMLEREHEGCINLALNYRQGFENMVRHMIGHGARDLVMIAGARGNRYSEERIAICQKVAKEVGIPLPEEKILYGNFWYPIARKELEEYLSHHPIPDTIICANDNMAIAACDVLCRRDIKVPKQVRVSGFDGTISSQRHDPTITTCAPDFTHAIYEMIDRIEHWDPQKNGETDRFECAYELVPNQSCGCVSKSHKNSSRIISSLIGENLDFSRAINEMGQFMRKSLNMNSMEDLSSQLLNLFSFWPKHYYCLAVFDEEERTQAWTLVHGSNGAFTGGARFPWQKDPLPDYDAVLSDHSISIALAHLLQTADDTMGYMVMGCREYSLREQQRFEEQTVFVSAAVSTCQNNRRLKIANESITKMAEHDFLTDLYNRRGFVESIRKRLESGAMQDRYMALYSVDLDGLKQINDDHGHAEGDRAICSIAAALRDVTKDRGVCARYGGDEFAFVLFVESEITDIEALRKQIEEKANQEMDSRDYTISASIGGCIRKVQGSIGIEEMLAEADMNLYADKRARKTMRV
ncbi:MAG: GGDEF domain-containing protein [Clostridia bacterium]|nr:GGDEF domain-containing protein [Clostridia bacterium]